MPVKYLLLILLLVPANVGCASALPLEGEVLRKVVSQNPNSSACRCEAVCQ